MNAWGLGLAVSAVLLAAAAVAGARQWPEQSPVSPILRWGIGLTLGLSAWGAGLLVLLFFSMARPHAIRVKDLGLAVAAAVIILVRRRPSRASAPCIHSTGMTSPQGVAIACLMIFAAAGFVFHAVRKPDGDWDAWAIWNARARFIARTGSAVRTFGGRLVHADYPPLLPALVAGGWLAAGNEAPWIAPTIAGAFVALAVIVLAGGAAEARGGFAALVALCVLLGTPQFLQLAQKQYADVPIGALLVAACALIALAAERRRASSNWMLLLAGAAGSSAALLKNEGLLEVLALAAALALVPRRSARPGRRLADAATFLTGALPLLALLTWFKLAIAPPNDLVASASLSAARSHLGDAGRYAILGRAMLWRFARVSDWNVFLPVLATGMIASLFSRRSDPARIIGTALCAVTAGFTLVYLLTPYDLEWHIRTSMDRLIIQLWPSLILLALLLVFPARRPLT